MRRPLCVVILGSTGSIGTQALEVCAEAPDRVTVVGLAASCDADSLAAQAERFGVPHLALRSPPDRSPTFPAGTALEIGESATVELIDRAAPDLVLNAIGGSAGLHASRATLERGIDLALANKESLVIAGGLLMELASRHSARLIPVDSEHNALAQCLRAGRLEEVRRLVLTASGGPFRGRKRNELAAVTPEEALRHPTWRMGRKITVDSATLMNKGLEIIEAHHLFGLPPESIEVLIHRQSTLHALVEFQDGSSIAHLGPADMRIPIRYALGEPDRWSGPESRFSLSEIGTLDFEEPDHETFPSLQMAYRACRRGGTLPAVLNAANEAAVEGFLAGTIGFLEIFHLVDRAMNEHTPQAADDWARLLRVDRETRDQVARWMS